MSDKVTDYLNQNTRYFNLLQNSEVSVSADMSTGEGQGSRGQQKVTEGSSGQDLIEGMCSIPEFYDGTSVFMTGVTGKMIYTGENK